MPCGLACRALSESINYLRFFSFAFVFLCPVYFGMDPYVICLYHLYVPTSAAEEQWPGKVRDGHGMALGQNRLGLGYDRVLFSFSFFVSLSTHYSRSSGRVLYILVMTNDSYDEMSGG